MNTTYRLNNTNPKPNAGSVNITVYHDEHLIDEYDLEPDDADDEGDCE